MMDYGFQDAAVAVVVVCVGVVFSIGVLVGAVGTMVLQWAL